ncbi:circularly permuted type 2 ATP-grasp protein [Modestobacter versicolor]|uniref:Carboxylate-amine ligase n=1 Tax=Modestobacter versicolor TaxID=429133 RepID=A0A323VA96_9ACTN|nr:circularly permuted type 2 ATP-grasp protein [Modestobacter versicolor]MBB3676671.1 carboxylate-amine ligase [Modestobacter versicolor]PZA21050.1 circularly permuted type 2 ATP-grasp protein [Modestobacter versicolor]
MTGSAGVFARYPGSAGDEAVGPDGSVREAYGPVAQVLDGLGGVGVAAVVGAIAQERRMRGVVFGAFVDGRLVERPFPLCPVPRVLSAADWAHLSAGVEQRTRALNAFLADVYRPAGRRRTDPDQHPEVVRAGIVPPWIVAASPGLRPGAVGLAAPGQPRITVSGLDLLHGPDGWVVLEDNLRVPSGIGYALTNRDSGRAALPQLYADAEAAGLVDPGESIALLRAALADAAPPGCPGVPQLGLLTDGPHNSAWFEHQLLAEALGIPVVTPDTLWPTPAGGVAVQVDGERVPVDVLYRRFDEADLGSHLTPSGTPVDVLLGEAVRAGKLALANVPGNGVADDKATYRYVPEMIRFYLGEEPVLATVPTWLLADDDDLAAARDRLHELVVKPVDGYGGQGVVFGPLCSAAELAELQAEVLATPHRFVAQEPVDFSTVPTVVDGLVVPRRADLRVFAVAGSTTQALPALLTRVALAEGSLLVNSSQGGGSKDTWVLPPA